ncbi:MAG TPA: hypothetical protein VMZ53_00920 [Kofleriaceae bacterium]|nr:hypothetical protein [Kofleriaceae bacterium]
MRTLLAILLLSTPAYAETWELKIPERVEVTAGTSGTLPISLAVDRGKTISKDAGIVLDLAPEGGLAVKKRRLARTDAVDPDADAPRFAVPVRADAAGDFTLRVRLRFWVCGQKVCKPVDAKRSVVVAVTAAP